MSTRRISVKKKVENVSCDAIVCSTQGFLSLDINKGSVASFRRYQDVHNQSYIMVIASGRWLGVRLDVIMSLLIGTVALAAVLGSQNAGKYINEIIFTQFCVL